MPPHRIVFLVLVATTFGLAVWGWYDINLARYDSPLAALDRAVFIAIRAVTFDAAYANPETWNWDWRIYAVSWMGAIISFWALLLAGRALFREQLARFSARHAKGHLLIVGDHPIAEALSELSPRKTVRLSFLSDRVVARRNKITLPATRLESANLESAGAGDAARIAVAMGDDAETAEIAFNVARRYKAPLVIAHMTDPWLAEHLHHAPDGARLFVFSEAQAAAREIVTRHPPYLTAAVRGASRIHALILGCGAFGEAVACEIALSCRVIGLEPPKLTMLDLDAHASEARFLARHPYAGQAVDLSFHAIESESLAFDATHLGAEPVTAVYVCLRDGVQALAAAIALKDRAARENLFDAPIFVRSRTGAGLPRLHPTGRLPRGCPLIAFAGVRDVAAATGIAAGEADLAARAWHKAYLAFQAKVGTSSVAWEDLPEDYRVANRRAIAHIPAKLASAGFDLEPWLNAGDLFDGLPALAPGQNLFRDDVELRSLGALEHDRWMADRHFNGWRYAPKHDDARKQHNDLRPFDDLAPAIQAYDTNLIVFLDQFLPRRAGGLTRA